MNAKSIFLFFIIFGQSFSVLNAQQANSFPVKAKTANGIIEGLYDTQAELSLYLGVPYAKPPVGNLRWQAPKPMDDWKGVKETKKFGPRAVQPPVFGDMRFRSDGMSEDCLYLNIWSSAKKGEKDLPVLVYFYGGGFVAGDGSEYRYDGAAMAQEGIVVVTVNYRLNIFGFFAHPSLSKESAYKGSGNYGLLDQVAALKWVKENITAFGGNPNHVTIAGESAGSIAVSAHIASPLSKGLIHGAIGESGGAVNPTEPLMPLKEAEQIGADFAKSSGGFTLEELRTMSTKEIYELYLSNNNLFGFPTVLDGYFLTEELSETFRRKKQTDVPVLLGWNSAEIPGGGIMGGLPYTATNFENQLKEGYPNLYKELLKVYSHQTTEEVKQSATDLASDRFINYSTWKWYDLHRQNSQQPIYRYLFSKPRPPLKSDLAAGKVIEKPIGACHSCEIEYCLGNLKSNTVYAWTKEDFAVSETMLSYFANFIKTGNPNGKGLPNWTTPQKGKEEAPVMIIDVNSRTINSQIENRYQLLDQVYQQN